MRDFLMRAVWLVALAAGLAGFALRPAPPPVAPPQTGSLLEVAPGLAPDPAPPPGTDMVQLGAYDSLAEAAADWQRIRDLLPGALDQTQPLLIEAQSGDRLFYRLRLVVTNAEAARRLCTEFDAVGQNCIPVRQR